MTNIKLMSGTALLLGAVLLVAINTLSENLLVGARLDLTEHHLYTLSKGTRSIIKRLDEPVTLRLYLSKKLSIKLPLIGPYATRVEELLREYTRLGQGKLRLEVVDPEPFSEDEDRAVSYGLQGVPLSDGESTFYFGLAASGPTDERAVIPFLATDRESFLEYDVTKLIHQVAWPKKPVVGLIDTLDLESPKSNPMGMPQQEQEGTPMALEQMRQSFDVRNLDKTVDRIPEDIDVLLLIQPLSLTETACYAVDQFVMRGGRVLAFVDPMPENGQGAPVAPDAAFNKLLLAWGVNLDSSKVVGDLQLARRVQYQRAGHIYTTQYPAWISLPQEVIDNTDVVTANLGSLNVASAGVLAKKDGATTQFVPLVHSTKNAALIDAVSLSMGADLQEVLRNFRPTGQTYTLAARVSGKVKTAFTDGAPPPPVADKKDETKPKPEPLPAHLSESKQPISLVLIADTDLLQDRFWVQVQNMLGMKLVTPNAANGSLLVNALDNLAGDNDLISVRNRGQFSRPFTRISELRQAAELQNLSKEKELVASLAQTEQRLVELERGKQGTGAGSSEGLILSAAQQQELENFRQEKIRTRKELRDVRHQLGKDIESLETWIKVFHLGIIPLLVATIGIWLGLRRSKRRYSHLPVSKSTSGNLAHA